MMQADFFGRCPQAMADVTRSRLQEKPRTFATTLQFSDEKEIKLKKTGRWKSDAYKGYVRSNVTNTTDTVGKSLSNPAFGNFFTFQRQA